MDDVYGGIIESQPISGLLNRAFGTETIEMGSIPGLVKPNTKKIGICIRVLIIRFALQYSDLALAFC